MITVRYFQTRAEAETEAARRRHAPDLAGQITRVERSRYGGFVVRSIPADLLIDSLTGDLPAASGFWPLRAPGI